MVPAAFYTMMEVWNNTGDRREIEELIKDTMPEVADVPHIVMPYWRDEQGNPYALFITQDPLHAGFQLVGLGPVRRVISDVFTERMTLTEAGAELYRGVIPNMRKQVAGFTSPLLKLLAGGRVDVDLFTGKPLYPEYLDPLSPKAEMSRINYMVDSLVIPWKEIKKILERKARGRGFIEVVSRGGIKTIPVEKLQVMVREYKAALNEVREIIAKETIPEIEEVYKDIPDAATRDMMVQAEVRKRYFELLTKRTAGLPSWGEYGDYERTQILSNLERMDAPK